VGGVNFATWPDLKWSRGKSHVACLESKFAEWDASAPVSVETPLREDREGFDLVAKVPHGVPKHEWALDLGDALHNLRSAFDAVAWGMAHFQGAKPARPRKVAFPICATEDKWEESLKLWVGGINPQFQERIRIMQPFNYGGGNPTVLSLLHGLDIQDKHHDSLEVSVDLDQIGLGGFFEYEDAESAATPRLEMRSEVKFADGVRLGTMFAGGRIKTHDQLVLRPAVKVQVSYEGTTHDAMPLMQQLVVESRRYLDILLSGLAAHDHPDDPQWQPLDVRADGEG
jgi:hypothetical protein